MKEMKNSRMHHVDMYIDEDRKLVCILDFLDIRPSLGSELDHLRNFISSLRVFQLRTSLLILVRYSGSHIEDKEVASILSCLCYT